MTTATRAARPVFNAYVMHDSEFNANESDKDLGYYRTLDEAVAAVNAARSDYWQTGGVSCGLLWEAVPGESPEWFDVDDCEPSYFVGVDGKADR